MGVALEILKLPSLIESRVSRVVRLERELEQLTEMNNARRCKYSHALKGNTG